MAEPGTICDEHGVQRFALPMFLDDEKLLHVLRKANLIGPGAKFRDPAPTIDDYRNAWGLAAERVATRGRPSAQS
jgi:hypothetical protein